MDDLISFHDEEVNKPRSSTTTTQKNTPYIDLMIASQKLMKSVKWFVDRNLVYGEDQIANLINKNKSEYLILKAAYNDDLRVETI